MVRYDIDELRDRLDEALRHALDCGETVVITRDGHDVARLGPVEPCPPAARETDFDMPTAGFEHLC